MEKLKKFAVGNRVMLENNFGVVLQIAEIIDSKRQSVKSIEHLGNDHESKAKCFYLDKKGNKVEHEIQLKKLRPCKS
jgi:hypothetical protein